MILWSVLYCETMNHRIEKKRLVKKEVHLGDSQWIKFFRLNDLMRIFMPPVF